MSLKGKKYEAFLVVFGALLYVFILLICAGTLTSGYHLADDHEILLNTERFREGIYTWKTFFHEGLFDYFAEGIRFRPFYSTLRLLRSYLFGTNYIAWSVLVGLEVAGCIILAYYVARNLKANIFFAALAAVFIVTGEQGEIWWRLGPQEPVGLLMCLGCMLLIQKYQIQPALWKEILIILSAFLMAASKESYTILLPAMILFGIGYDIWCNYNLDFGNRLKSAVRKNRWIIGILTALLCVNLYIIVFRVGVLSIGYAGIDTTEGIGGYIEMLKKITLRENMRPYLFLQLLSLFGIVFILVNKTKEEIIESVKKNGILIASLIIIYAVEAVLYAKSGMWGRYFVPFTAGIAFFNIAFISSVFKRRWYKYFFGGIVFCMIIYLYHEVWNNGIIFAEQGRNLAEGFQVIEKSFEPDQMIVSCMDLGGEWDYSFTHYAKIQMGMKNVYTWNESVGFSSLYQENEKDIDELSEADCLIIPEDKSITDFIVNGNGYECLFDLGYGKVYEKVVT